MCLDYRSSIIYILAKVYIYIPSTLNLISLLFLLFHSLVTVQKYTPSSESTRWGIANTAPLTPDTLLGRLPPLFSHWYRKPLIFTPLAVAVNWAVPPRPSTGLLGITVTDNRSVWSEYKVMHKQYTFYAHIIQTEVEALENLLKIA